MRIARQKPCNFFPYRHLPVLRVFSTVAVIPQLTKFLQFGTPPPVPSAECDSDGMKKMRLIWRLAGKRHEEEPMWAGKKQYLLVGYFDDTLFIEVDRLF